MTTEDTPRFYVEGTLPDGRLMSDDRLTAEQVAELRAADAAGRVILTHVGPALMSAADVRAAFGGAR